MLRELADRAMNLSAPLAACGEIMLTSIDRNFEAQGRYGAAGDVRGGTNKWQPLARATIISRLGGNRAFTKSGGLSKPAQRKLGGLKILQQRGTLAASFTKQISGNTLTIGSNRVYAAIHHYGGQAGRGKKVFIPARPFLVVQDEDVENMIGVLRRYLEV